MPFNYFKPLDDHRVEVIHPVSTIVDMRGVKEILRNSQIISDGVTYVMIKLVYDKEKNPHQESDVTFIVDAMQAESVYQKLLAKMPC